MKLKRILGSTLLPALIVMASATACLHETMTQEALVSDAKNQPATQKGSAAMNQQARDKFINNQAWPDSNGVHINAHGGGFLFHDGVYYWFGEHKIAGEAGNAAMVGIHCYSSKDLYNWRDEGIAMPVSEDPSSEIAKSCVIERPKVIYNAKTGKFVMWFHLERTGSDYKDGLTGLAVADKVAGPYTYVKSLRPNAGIWPMNVADVEKLNDPGAIWLKRGFKGGQMSRDMNLFLDDDGKAYHIDASEANHTLHIRELSDDFLSFTGRYTRVFPGKFNEAPAICKRDGRYWMLSSGCSGWNPNPARSAVADSMLGEWSELGNPCEEVNPKNHLGPEKTFGGQSTYILPVNGKPGAFIAIFDVWTPKNPIDGGYIWLPMEFDVGRFKVAWRDEWDLSFFDKKGN